ncbi:MAG TPA: hypothetical protein VJN50_05700 [Actinomycetota bacterium]|nr:hypothetical protein [Actinomycetota bacterium]
MHARLTVVTGSPGQIKDVAQRINELVLPRLGGISGLRNAYFLSDDASGKTVAVTIFESEADLIASREAVKSIREETVTAMGGTVQSVDELEVIAQL